MIGGVVIGDVLNVQVENNMIDTQLPIILSGSSNPNLAYGMTLGRNIIFGNVYLHTFPSGEKYCQIKENIRGKDVFLVQSICNPVNDNLMELLVMADAARRASAGRITAIIPNLGYARQDRKDKPRVPISAKLVMDIIEASGVDRVVTMDLHAPQIAGFTNLPFDHLYFLPCLIEQVKEYNIDTIVSPDVGGVKRAESAAHKMNVDIGFISKKRKNDTDVEVTAFVGDVRNKNVLILDDITESAGTITQAAEICQQQGARKIFAAVTHGAFSSLGVERLERSIENGVIEKFFYSNTIFHKHIFHPKMISVDVSNLFGTALTCIHNDQSISSLF